MPNKKKNAALDAANIEDGRAMETTAEQPSTQFHSTATAGALSTSGFLRHGAREAISGEELAALAGISKRTLQRRIAEERVNGVPILSRHGGYFLPDQGPAGKAEIQAYLLRLRRTIARTMVHGIGPQIALMELDFIQENQAGGCDMCG